MIDNEQIHYVAHRFKVQTDQPHYVTVTQIMVDKGFTGRTRGTCHRLLQIVEWHYQGPLVRGAVRIRSAPSPRRLCAQRPPNLPPRSRRPPRRLAALHQAPASSRCTRAQVEKLRPTAPLGLISHHAVKPIMNIMLSTVFGGRWWPFPGWLVRQRWLIGRANPGATVRAFCPRPSPSCSRCSQHRRRPTASCTCPA